MPEVSLGVRIRVSPAEFNPDPDFEGNFAYRFLNRKACELGDLSGMKGELVGKRGDGSVTILPLETPGFAQMSAEFGEIFEESVAGDQIHTNCDSSGPPAAHATNCGCVRYNGKHSPSRGTIT